MKRHLYILILLLLPLAAAAESKQMRDSLRHEVRIGWGDQLFETLVWHAPQVVTIIPSTPYFDPLDYRESRKENYRYTQHLFAEYHYRWNKWLSFGGLFDASAVLWDNVVRNGKGAEVSRDPNQHFYNLVIMPTVRFTYLWHPYVSLYSGVGLGMDINGGTEIDAMGRQTVVGAALNITALALSVNYQRYFVSIEWGGMYAFENPKTLFMVSSRIFTASFGVHL